MVQSVFDIFLLAVDSPFGRVVLMVFVARTAAPESTDGVVDVHVTSEAASSSKSPDAFLLLLAPAANTRCRSLLTGCKNTVCEMLGLLLCVIESGYGVFILQQRLEACSSSHVGNQQQSKTISSLRYSHIAYNGPSLIQHSSKPFTTNSLSPSMPPKTIDAHILGQHQTGAV